MTFNLRSKRQHSLKTLSLLSFLKSLIIMFLNSIGVCEEGHTRVLIEDEFNTYTEDFDMYDDADHDIIFFNDILSRGRVEICVLGRYRSVCANDWGNKEASVVCRELGLAANGRRVCIHAPFHTSMCTYTHPHISLRLVHVYMLYVCL